MRISSNNIEFNYINQLFLGKVSDRLTSIHDPQNSGQALFGFEIRYQNPSNILGGMVQPLYNGNISQTFWRTANDNKLRGYAYSYDALNRLNTAYYRKGTTYSNNFNESLSYDKNGNILSLQRWGVPEDYGTVPAIPNMDDLTYTYFPNSNKLRKVSDGVASTKGFNDGVNLSTEYIYDPNANMKEDKNKGITEIKYNHLNLPTEIKFSNHQKIAYIYNALGTKIEKTVTNGSDISKTEYLDSFQYIDGELQFFPVSEGYVRKTEGNRRQQFFDYVYNYTDHLGNIRLSYTTDPQSPSNIKILEESNYYPFGLQHGSYNTPARDYRPIGDAREVEMVDRNPYRYKYNAKEYQDELGLDWYDYGWRQYDPAIGRWQAHDPLAEQYRRWSPYNYAVNNPIRFIDPDGMAVDDFIDIDKKTGKITITENDKHDTVRLIDNGEVVVSYVYGEDDSFESENDIIEIEQGKKGIQLIDATENRNSKRFFEFAAQSDAEFSISEWSSNQTIIATSHEPAAEHSLTFTLSYMQDRGAQLLRHTHSHPDESIDNIILSDADRDLKDKVLMNQKITPKLYIYSPLSKSYYNYTDQTFSIKLEGIEIMGKK